MAPPAIVPVTAAQLVAMLSVGDGSRKRTRDDTEAPEDQWENPVVTLKAAAEPPAKKRMEERIDIVSDAINTMVAHKDELIECTMGTEGCFNLALDDMRKWNGLLADLRKCQTPGEINDLVRVHWDCTTICVVRDAKNTRTGCRLRKAFRAAAQRRWFELVQLEAIQARTSERFERLAATEIPELPPPADCSLLMRGDGATEEKDADN